LPTCLYSTCFFRRSRGLTAEVLPDYERNLARLLRQPSTANFSKDECEYVCEQTHSLSGEVKKLERLVQPMDAAQADLERSEQKVAQLSPQVFDTTRYTTHYANPHLKATRYGVLSR